MNKGVTDRASQLLVKFRGDELAEMVAALELRIEALEAECYGQLLELDAYAGVELDWAALTAERDALKRAIANIAVSHPHLVPGVAVEQEEETDE